MCEFLSYAVVSLYLIGRDLFLFSVLPGEPGKPNVRPGSITAVIMWENGDSGNIPFEKFEIQSRTDGKWNGGQNLRHVR